MLIVVGGARDREARAAIDQLGHDRAALLDASDLSRPGWCLSPQAPDRGRIVASGRGMPVEFVAAVLVRRRAIHVQELTHVHADDRAYVAAEMTALLTWWLSALEVPVVNRPRGGSLCGPAWRPEQWRLIAARRGIPALESERDCAVPSPLEPWASEVVVVGGAVLGDAPVGLARSARALAEVAGLALVAVAFDERGAVVTASALPRLTPKVVGAVAAHVGLA